MNRQQKEIVVDLFNKNFSASKGSFFVDYSGLTVAQMQQLRKQLHTKGGSLKVAKMRLVRRALENVSGFSNLASHCKNQLGVVFAQDAAQVSGVAKTLYDFSKQNEELDLIVGCMNARLLDKAAIIKIASLPSKEVLLAQLCGMLKTPMAGLVNGLNGMIVKLLFALKEIEKQKQS